MSVEPDDPPASTRRYRQVARARATEGRRWRILRAAWDLFAERRYDDISVAAIAERAGVSERTVYRLVGPKERLLDGWEEQATEERTAWTAGEDVERPWALRIGWQRWLHDDHGPIEPGDIAGFVAGTVRFHEEWGDALENVRRQAHEVQQFARFIAYSRRRHHENVDQLVGHLVAGPDADARRRRLELLYAVTDFPMWHVLRRDTGLGRQDVQAALLDLVQKLIESDS